MIENKVSGMSIFTTLIQHGIGSSRQHSKTREKKAYITDWKGRKETVPICL